MRFLFIGLLSFLSITTVFSQDTNKVMIRKVKVKRKFKETDLFPRLCGKLDGEINFDEISENPLLHTTAKLDIVSFKMSLRVGSGDLVYMSKNQHLTPVMLNKIGNLKSGEEMLFYDIKAKHYSGKLIQLQPLRLTYR